jgi:hypothetical protein
MKTNDGLNDVEKRLRAAMSDAGSEDAVPPFEEIARRIETGQSGESFEEFFGEDTPSREGGSLPKGLRSFRTAAIVGVSAAFVCIVGGLAAGAVLNGFLNQKSAMDSAAETAYCDEMMENKAETDDLEESRQDVSPSDLDDCDSAVSSQPEKQGG